MTTIAYRAGVLAADSMESIDSDGGGSRYRRSCTKIFRKMVEDPATGTGYEILVAMAGDSYPSMVFLDWYPGIRWFRYSGFEVPEVPEMLKHTDGTFDALILEPDADDYLHLYESDVHCRPVEITDEFWAVGSGCKAAMAAMLLGKSALDAVKVAAEIDPYTRGPFKKESL